MTAQEIFNRVARHLLDQGERSATDGGCLYRGPRGLSCAVGCLLTDADYQPNMEGEAFNAIVRLWLGKDHPLAAHTDLLCELQGIHDSGDPKQWAWHLSVAGQRRGLSLDVIEERER